MKSSKTSLILSSINLNKSYLLISLLSLLWSVLQSSTNIAHGSYRQLTEETSHTLVLVLPQVSRGHLKLKDLALHQLVLTQTQNAKGTIWEMGSM